MAYRTWQDKARTIPATKDGDPVAVVDDLATVFGKPVRMVAGDGSRVVLREGYIEIGDDEPLPAQHDQRRPR